MWQQEFIWFFTIFHHEFRKNNAIAFEVLMVLAVAHVFGFYNPKQLADFLEVPHQQFYTALKEWSVYHVKKMLLRFMVKQAAEQLKPRVSKNAVFGLNFLPGFWTRQMSCIMPILTGFGPHPRGPKSGQEKLADLDALGLCTLQVMHHGIPQPSITSW